MLEDLLEHRHPNVKGVLPITLHIFCFSKRRSNYGGCVRYAACTSIAAFDGQTSFREAEQCSSTCHAEAGWPSYLSIETPFVAGGLFLHKKVKD